MAGLVLELIKFLPPLSADSSFLLTQKWAEELWDGEGVSPDAEPGGARAVRVRAAPVQGHRQDLPSGTNGFETKENTLLILGVFTEHHTQGVKFSL